ncbi:unnamed protein product [Enterobius vermicularis]|uniref:Fn3_like domain-containing protein n=1 Tax=Enterobius vermicularis TaxID=51028 RepID=A0A0N4UT46_ENTVE|nr:unnamed protein product [Enterobius vermicularis]
MVMKLITINHVLITVRDVCTDVVMIFCKIPPASMQRMKIGVHNYGERGSVNVDIDVVRHPAKRAADLNKIEELSVNIVAFELENGHMEIVRLGLKRGRPQQNKRLSVDSVASGIQEWKRESCEPF